jgi:biopolymer transport protein ExbD
MIDIVFLLIIFFMVGTKFVEMERQIAVQVPEVADAGNLSPAPAKRIINVHRDGQISLDRRFVTIDQLTSELTAARRQHKELGVIVRGDGEGTFQNVAAVMNACTQAGISDMGISVRFAQKERVLK